MLDFKIKDKIIQLKEYRKRKLSNKKLLIALKKPSFTETNELISSFEKL